MERVFRLKTDFDPLKFHVADFIVLGVTVAVPLVVGFFFACRGRHKGTAVEFIVGNRHMPLFPVTVSLIVCYFSAIVLLGLPAEIYQHGTQFSAYVIGCFISIMAVTGLFVPLFHPLRISSVQEYLELRYNSRALKVVCSLFTVIVMILYMGLALSIPCQAVQGVTDLPAWLPMVFIAVLTTTYTSLGGLKAVVWTNLFQAFVILASLVTTVVLGIYQLGGPVKGYELLHESKRVEFLDLDPMPNRRTSLWSVSLIFGVTWMSLYTSQPVVQHFSAVESLTKAKVSMALTAFGVIILGLLSCLSGAVAVAHYFQQGCDPIEAGHISSPREILLYYIVNVLHYPGFPGLFLACLVSCSLSSISAVQNSVGGTIWEDLIKSKFYHVSEGAKMTAVRLSVVLAGILGLGVGFASIYVGEVFTEVSLYGMAVFIGPYLGIFLLGATFTFVGGWSSLMSAVLSMGFVAWLCSGYVMWGPTWSALEIGVDKCNETSAPGNSSLAIHPPVANGNVSYRDGLASLPFCGSNVNGSSLCGSGPPEGSPLWWLFNISPLCYPFIGVCLTWVIGLLLSIIPVCRQRIFVEQEHLFPFARWIREHCCGYDRTEAVYSNLTASPNAAGMFHDTSRTIYQKNVIQNEKSPNASLNTRLIITENETVI